MSALIFSNTEALQTRIVAEADDRTLILTSGGRLARQLRHGFRLHQKQKGRKGWLRPEILSLNAWVEKTWQETWPEEVRPSNLRILRLWEEAVKEGDVPEGLTADIQLYQILNETYQARIRNKVPSTEDYVHPLITWRDEVIKRFEVLLNEQGLIHSAHLPLRVLRDLANGPTFLPEKIFLTGFEFPAPIERDLLQVLRSRYGAVYYSTHSLVDPILKAVSFPNQEEEVYWLAEQILEAAQQTPLHRIGLVVPAFAQYAPSLAAAFQELIGPTMNEQGGCYNISLGQPLWKQPLVQAGILPLRFMLEGQSRTLFLSLILSPFYLRWKGHRPELAQADGLWRKQGVDKGLEALISCLGQSNFREEYLMKGGDLPLEDLLMPFQIKEQSGGDWVKALLQCWKMLGFPAIEGPGEEGFYRHFLEILQGMADDLRSTPLEGTQFFAWLKYLLMEALVNEPGHEQAGLQIVGLIEARGLAFDHLFLAGLSKGSLPQAVRTFPFLTPEERRMVQGATFKSQFDFAQAAFAHLRTVAPQMTLTRPEEDQGDPLPPSPLWPEGAEKKGRNIWTSPGRVWMRAEWLRQTRNGNQKVVPSSPLEDFPVKHFVRPSTLSVTALETFLSCPFKFFSRQVLALNPLEEILIGITPLEKGDVLHSILAQLTKTIRQKDGYFQEGEALYPLIAQCVKAVLLNKSGDPHWLLEQKRLLGEDADLGGLLGAWMTDERERWEKGWRWEKEEISFNNLRLPSWGLPLRGRIDRIDRNENSSEAYCWDYKTGRLPGSKDISKNFLAAQLPIYLLALKTAPDLLEKGYQKAKAGYIGLKSEGEFRVQEPFKDSEEWEACLLEWEKVVGDTEMEILSGRFPADPKPKPRGHEQGACHHCPYLCLCAYWRGA
jgi:RecB family exonuclease